MRMAPNKSPASDRTTPVKPSLGVAQGDGPPQPVTVIAYLSRLLGIIIPPPKAPRHDEIREVVKSVRIGYQQLFFFHRADNNMWLNKPYHSTVLMLSRDMRGISHFGGLFRVGYGSGICKWDMGFQRGGRRATSGGRDFHWKSLICGDQKRQNFSKRRATPAGYARMLATLASRARARASGICGISQNKGYLSLR